MKSLLASLDVESFVFDLVNAQHAPIVLDGIHSRQIDPSTLEVTLKKGENLNDVFTKLSAQNIEVASMRNKANRLEELFLGIVENNLTEKLSNE